MSDPRRPDPLLVSEPSENGDVRDAQVEGFLVEGLDRYFNGRYEEAVHVWTRVLFLDRSHSKARAYIDRARTAIAERQRQSDELLHASQELLDRGQAIAARNLLAKAMATAGDDERAAALRARLERLERVLAASPHFAPAAEEFGNLGSPRAPAAPRWPAWARRVSALAGLAAGLALLTMMITDSILPQWVGFSPVETALVRGAAPLRVLSSADAALVRARTLYAGGRLTDALQVLTRVGVDSPVRPDADRLRVEIQRLLLAGLPTRTSPGGEAR